MLAYIKISSDSSQFRSFHLFHCLYDLITISLKKCIFLYSPQSSMESDPVTPFVVLPTGHILQVVSSVPAYVSTEHLVHTSFMITVPTSVHTVSEKYNLSFYCLTQIIIWVISVLVILLESSNNSQFKSFLIFHCLTYFISLLYQLQHSRWSTYHSHQWNLILLHYW